jgi:hypothetical protein
VDIISNDVEPRSGMTIDQEGGWQIKYHDERYETHHSYSVNLADTVTVVLDTTNHWLSDRTPTSQRTSDPPCSMPGTASQTCPPPGRPTCFSRKRVTI